MHIVNGQAGTMSDATIVRLDDLLMALRDRRRYRVVFRMRTKDGAGEVVSTGAYVIVDGGYLTWRCLQKPVPNATSEDARRWSEMVESVRKDVERSFG